MIRTIGIAGYKKSGKTKMVEKIVEKLKKQDYRVGTVKHVPQEGFTLDQPNTDSWRHAQAGADEIVSISPDEVATIEKRSNAELGEVLLGLENLDFVIIEGFRESEIVPKIMVACDIEEASKLDDEFTVGFVGSGVEDKPVFADDDVDSIVNLIKEKAISPVGNLDCGECGYDSCRDFILATIEGDAPVDGCLALGGSVSLHIDGKRVPLKSFVKDFIANSVSGMISSLKRSEGKKIVLEVNRDEG